jgi:hypothetical protein
MIRFVRLLPACLALCGLFTVAACGDDEETVTISVFQGAPDAIELGQSTKLVFVVEPKDAEITIAEVGNVTGKLEASVSPTATTTYHLTATKGSSTASKTANITVGPTAAAAIKVEPATATPIAGDSVSVTVTALVANGQTAPGFRGTVKLTSSDPQAVLPPDLVFAAGDAGVKQVKVTLKTAGLSTLTGTDAAVSTRRGFASVTVGPAAAATCAMTQAPATTAAGAVVGVGVVLRDAFNNIATGYAGTIALTASDARALLPAPVTFAAPDAGTHVFSASLVTAGTQTLTATDTGNGAIQCSASLVVVTGGRKIVLTVPANANAGYAVNVGVAVKDSFDNPVTDYAGTVTFTSTDGGAGAQAPAPIVFTGSEGGVATAAATFTTIGSQLLSASDAGAPAANGAAALAVHGLVYTAPNTGRVRLVQNAAGSNTQIVQLDLIATERLEVSSFFGGGPGPHSAGMNLPLDTTRVGPDTTLFTFGNAFILAQPSPNPPLNPTAAGKIGDDHVLYTVVSRRRVAGTVFNQLNEVLPGRVFYSVRLKLTPDGTVGPVFDGAQPTALFRAAVRDQYGDDAVSYTEFGVGKLEIR